MLKEKLDKILLKVQKPSRYIGGEVNAVVKDKSKVDIRFAMCRSLHGTAAANTERWSKTKRMSISVLLSAFPTHTI